METTLPISEQNMDDEEHDIFTATTTEISHITAVLSSIIAIGTQGKVFVSSDGLIFVCENSHTMRVSATFDKGLFEQYHFSTSGKQSRRDTIDKIIQGHNETDVSLSSSSMAGDGEEDSRNDTDLSQRVKRLRKHASETVKICLDLTKVVESFNIASSLNKFTKEANNNGSGNSNSISNIKCTLSYKGYGHPFVISFKDPVMTERCEFATFVDMDSENNQDSNSLLQLDITSLVMEVVLQADIISDALNNLKDLNSDDLYVYASNRTTGQRTLDNERLETNQLMFISKGEIGYSRFIFPNLEKLVLRKFDHDSFEYKQIKNDFIVGVYKFEMFKRIMRAVKLSSKLRIRKDINGVISVHLLSASGIDNNPINLKVNAAFPNNNSRNQPYHQQQQQNQQQSANANKPGKVPYSGTIIEFVLLELAVSDDDELDGSVDKHEIIELINHAEKVATINPKNKKRRKTRGGASGNRQTRKQGASNMTSKDRNILEILKNKERHTNQDLGDTSTNNTGNPGSGQIKGINEILHDITIDNGSGPLAEGYLDIDDANSNDININGQNNDDNDVTLFF